MIVAAGFALRYLLSLGFADTFGQVIGILAIALSFMLANFFATAYYQAEITNYTLSRTYLDKVKVKSNLDSLDLAFIYLTNTLMIAFTLGLAIPWAKVRILRYRLSRTFVLSGSREEIEEFLGEQTQKNQNAIADAAVDFWDIDIGF